MNAEKLKWQQAPVKTQWGDDMVVASVAIDNDHTVCLYCERDQTTKVEAMFDKREWADKCRTYQDMMDATAKDADRAYELLRRAETEMRYAGWTEFESDNPARNGVYEQIKELLK